MFEQCTYRWPDDREGGHMSGRHYCCEIGEHTSHECGGAYCGATTTNE